MTKQVKTHVPVRIVIHHNNSRKQILTYEKVHKHNLLLIMLDLEYLKHQRKIKDYEFYYDVDVKTKIITDFIKSR